MRSQRFDGLSLPDSKVGVPATKDAETEMCPDVGHRKRLRVRKHSTAMRAGFCVEAVFVDTEALDGTSGDEVLRNDVLGVFGADVAVPDPVRVDDDCGAVLALIETSRLVDAHAAGKTGFFAQLLQAGVQFALSIAGAGGARRIGGTDVVADEDVAFKPGQWGILLDEAGFKSKACDVWR